MQKHERERYRLHAKLPAYRRNVVRAQELITRALIEVPGVWAMCASGGKDSGAMMAMALQTGWSGPVVHYVARGEMPEENTRLLRELCDRYSLELHEVPVPGPWEAWEAVGHFFAVPETPEEKAAYRRFELDWSAANDYAEQQGWVGQFMGMRKEESKRRSMVLGKRGGLYKTQSRSTWTCCPLMQWKGPDIWACLLENDMPWLSVYDDAPRGREMERSEFTWFEESLWRHGQVQEFRQRFPERWARLCARWPEIRSFA